MDIELALDSGRVRGNLERVEATIARACERSGRKVGSVEILAATKYVDSGAMGVLAEAGIALVGENRAQDLTEKQDRWGDAFVWDFIGHLQSRKVRDVLPRVRKIHSLCSESALDQIKRRAREPAAALVEVNISGEATKSGLQVDALNSFVEQAAQVESLQLVGLSTMPPLADDPEASRRHFAALRRLAEQLRQRWATDHPFNQLSMGTSHDYSVAVEEGATTVRLGTVLFR